MKNLIVTILLMCSVSFLHAQTDGPPIIKTNDINTFFEPSKFPNGFKTINVYGKKECDRCETFVAKLTEFKMPFTLLDLNNSEVFSEMDQKVYKSLAHKELGYSLSFPIIEIDGTMFFCIANHGEFVVDLYEHWKKFN